MLVEATNRVSPRDHWDIYRKALAEHEGLLDSLSEAIGDYLDDLLEGHGAEGVEVDSSKACSEVMKRWTEAGRWKKAFGADHRRLFGMVMWVFLYDDRRPWYAAEGANDRSNNHVYELIVDDEVPREGRQVDDQEE